MLNLKKNINYKKLSATEIELEINRYFIDNILPTFNQNAKDGLKKNLNKNIFEIINILSKTNVFPENINPKVMDFGCGLGINLMILSGLFGIESYGIDRGEEFSSEHKREVGDVNELEARLLNFGVKFVKQNPTIKFDPKIKVDIVTSFDVIEHFSFSPNIYLENMFNSLNINGFILIGTPNQAHFLNRIKLLFGYNVWEDFNYWRTCNIFYGHVRELTSHELLTIPQSLGFKNIELISSSYPFIYTLKSRFIFNILNKLFSCINMNYYNLVIGKK